MSSRTPSARIAKRKPRPVTTIAVIDQSPKSKVQSFLNDFELWTLDFGLSKLEALVHTDRVNLVSDGYLVYHVQPLCHLAEVGVLAVQEARVFLDDEELAVAVQPLVRSASHAQRAVVERQVVILGAHLAATAARAARVAALDYPVLDAVKLQA